MNFTRANLTDLGLALNAKIQAGRGTVPLHITRIVLGMGTSETPTSQTDVIAPLEFFVPIIRQTSHNNMAEIQIQITNVGNPDLSIPPLMVARTFQQIGFIAVDPDLGEILYRISQLENAAFIPAAIDFPYTVAPIYIFSTANAENVNITVDPAGLVTVRMLADHNRDPNAHENRFAALLRLIGSSDNNGAVTINDREPIPQDGTASTGTLVQILGRLAHMLRLIRGKSHWWVDPNGGNNGWSVTDGVLSNTVPFGEVVDGVLVFDDGFATVNDGIVDLT